MLIFGIVFAAVWSFFYGIFFSLYLLTIILLSIFKRSNKKVKVDYFLRNNWIWESLRGIFETEIKIDDEDNLREIFRQGNCIIIVHPHGFIPIGVILHFLAIDKRIPYNFSVAIHSALYHSPIFGTLVKKMGGIEANTEEITKRLKQGSENVVICAGGIQEMCSNDLYLEHRGYEKIAIEMNAKVCVVYIDGEKEIFPPISNMFLNVRSWLSSKLRFPIRFPPFTFNRTKITLFFSLIYDGNENEDEDEEEKDCYSIHDKLVKRLHFLERKKKLMY